MNGMTACEYTQSGAGCGLSSRPVLDAQSRHPAIDLRDRFDEAIKKAGDDEAPAIVIGLPTQSDLVRHATERNRRAAESGEAELAVSQAYDLETDLHRLGCRALVLGRDGSPQGIVNQYGVYECDDDLTLEIEQLQLGPNATAALSASAYTHDLGGGRFAIESHYRDEVGHFVSTSAVLDGKMALTIRGVLNGASPAEQVRSVITGAALKKPDL